MKGNAYLSLYNRFQIAAWLVLPFLIVLNPPLACRCLKVSQLAMLLDVVHAFIGLTKTSPIAAVLQIASRVYILCLNFSTCSPEPSFRLMCMCWSAAEVLRFAYYEFNAFKWLRYTAFILLYPVGVFLGELPLLWEHMRRTGFWLDYLAAAAYVPGFPFLFSHMLRARKRALCGRKPRKPSD